MNESSQIDLATTAPFRIGPLYVEPALRQVSTDTSQPETIEPRVMLVLVALAQAEGGIVSRDRLIAQCWYSRVVGDDSINRVISRLRKLPTAHGDDALFTIETISKVGYRLVVPAAAPVVAPAPVTGPRLRMLPSGPANAPVLRRRPRIAMACGGAALWLAAVAWPGHFPATSQARPVVEVEPFVITGAGLAPGLPMQIRSETADFLANERLFSISRGPGSSSSPANWRVKGSIAPTEAGRRVTVFAQLFKPGSDIAVTELRVDRDAALPMLARSIGLRVGRTSNCILLNVTDPDLTGGYQEAGLSTLVDACVIWHDKGSSVPARIEKFRAAAKAFPRSSYFPARLGEMLGDMAADNAGDPVRLRFEGSTIVEAARRNDPTQPHIFLARARLLPALDLFGREAWFRKALAGRPSDCACEFGDYSSFLSMVGRNREARAFAERAHEKEPKNVPWLRRAGETAAIDGDLDAARSDLALVAGLLPDRSSLDAWRMNIAIWSRDWALANAMNARESDPALQGLQGALIASLASGNSGRIHSAARPYLARSRSVEEMDRATVTALATADRPLPAIAAAERLIARHPLSLAVLFEPEFAAARQMPEFTRLATRLGLTGYWRRSGHTPDFCLAHGAPTMCAGMASTPKSEAVADVSQ